MNNNVSRAFILIELCGKETVNNEESKVFSSLNLLKVFTKEFGLSTSSFYNIITLLKAFGVLTVGVGDKVLSKPKYTYFQKQFPEEYNHALKYLKGAKK